MMRYLVSAISLTLDVERCNGCRRCTEVCPHGVFAIEARRARIVDRNACMECGACVRNCRNQALFVRAGVGCALTVITSSSAARDLS